MNYIPASDVTLLIRFADSITPEAYRQVLRLIRSLADDPPLGVHDVQPAYGSVLLRFDPQITDHARLEKDVVRIWKKSKDEPLEEYPAVRIPVCYEPMFAPDLEELARWAGMKREEVIALHAGTEYQFYFYGFSPGFGYLGEVPAAIAMPRRATPRPSVPPGSVGIAGPQTGIYPHASPGGWNLIGRTPWRLFNLHDRPFSPLLAGVRVRFVPITAEEFERGLE